MSKSNQQKVLKPLVSDRSIKSSLSKKKSKPSLLVEEQQTNFKTDKEKSRVQALNTNESNPPERSDAKSQPNNFMPQLQKEIDGPVKKRNLKHNGSGMILPIAPSKRNFANVESFKPNGAESTAHFNLPATSKESASNVHPDILKLDRNYQKSVSPGTKTPVSVRDDNSWHIDHSNKRADSKSVQGGPPVFSEEGIVGPGSDANTRGPSRVELSSKSLIERECSEISNNSIEKLSLIRNLQKRGDNDEGHPITIRVNQNSRSWKEKPLADSKDQSLMNKRDNSLARRSADTLKNIKHIMLSMRSQASHAKCSQRNDRLQALKNKTYMMRRKLFSQGLSHLIVFFKKKLRSQKRVFLRTLYQISH